MKINDLLHGTGEWLRGGGADSDVVVSSRLRLARNLADYPFLSTAGETERTEVYRALADAITAQSDFSDSLLVDLAGTDDLDRQLLVERHLISRQHASAEGSRGVSISPDETRSLMINEEDHLRIQLLRTGFQPEALWEEVSAIDDCIGSEVPFAFDQQLGYLTACPTNVGTGLRVSVMLHLPGLKFTKEIERVARAARDMRLAVRGLYGEGTDAVGDFFQISNQTTLGKSEEEIIAAFGSTIIPKIVDYERTARQSLVQLRPHQLDDKVWRAYGVLTHARCISSEETMVLLSPIRMAIHLGRFDKFDIKTLNELFLYSQPAHLQKQHGQPLDAEQRGPIRADFIRKRLAV